MPDQKTSIVLPLEALNPSDVLAEPVTVKDYTLYPKNWELSKHELETLNEWRKTLVEVYADPRVTGINMLSNTISRRPRVS